MLVIASPVAHDLNEMPTRPSSVSVTDPLTPALRRVKTILFAPFDLRKWFIIGFCAWLSSCGENDGGGGGGGGGGGNGGDWSEARQGIRHGLESAGEYVMDARYTPEEGLATEEDGKLPVSGLIEAVALDAAKACYYLEEGELAIYLEELE